LKIRNLEQKIKHREHMIKTINDFRKSEQQQSKFFSSSAKNNKSLKKRYVNSLLKKDLKKEVINTPLKGIEQKDSLFLNIKNHLFNYPTPINLTHA
jgi:hypothetical protein